MALGAPCFLLFSATNKKTQQKYKTNTYSQAFTHVFHGYHKERHKKMEIAIFIKETYFRDIIYGIKNIKEIFLFSARDTDTLHNTLSQM